MTKDKKKADKKEETKNKTTVVRVVKKASALKTSKDYEVKGNKYQGFDHFWAVMAHKHQLKATWKSSFKAHIKKMGFDSSDKYEDGLKHFLGK